MSDNLTNEEKLNRILELTEENNKMLRSMRRSQLMGSIFRIFYWLVIIGSMAAAYYFLMPLISGLISNVGPMMEQLNAIKGGIPDPSMIQKALEQAGSVAQPQ